MAGKGKTHLKTGTFIDIPAIAGEIFELLFPSHCVLCRKKCREKICPECRADFKYIDPPICRLCGSPLEDEDQNTCDICMLERPPYSLCRSVLHYEGKLRDAILSLKYKRELKIADILATYLAAYIDENPYIFSADLMVPVPQNNKSGNSHFGSASAFCFFLRKETGNPAKAILSRTRNTEPQFNLSPEQRWENVKDAFEVIRGENIKGKKILLIDDIFTTGATVTNCTKALISAGASSVAVLTLSRAVLKSK